MTAAGVAVPPAPIIGGDGDGLDETMYDEMFDLLWGRDRGVVPTAVDHAYESIWKRLMMDGADGTSKECRLSDAALATQLGVSRTPVRQALTQLAQDGLVRIDPRRGFWTRTFTVKDIHEIYDLRGTLEALALRLAAPALDAAALEREMDLLHSVRARIPARPVALFLRCDLRLHNLLIHASGNERLIRFLATLRSQHGLFQIRDTAYPARMAATLDDHERILRALIDGRVDDAGATLVAHIAHAQAFVLTDLFGQDNATNDDRDAGARPGRPGRDHRMTATTNLRAESGA